MKTKILLLAGFLALAVAVHAAPSFDGDGDASADAAYKTMAKHYAERPAPAFNALSPSDPHYREYQAGLCAATYADYRQAYSDRYWLDHLDPKMAGMTPDGREAWVEGYVLTTVQRDKALELFDTNCR